MLSELSSNVILAKARAMHGRRLKEQNYNDLLACRSVREVADYLKSHTEYAKVLSGIAQNEIHRGLLEARLRQKLLEDNASLCRYEITVGEHLSQYFIRRNETEQILRAILFLEAGTPEEFLFSIPAFLFRHSRVNLRALSRIQSYDDLLRALNHTPYQKILEPFRPDENGWIDYTGIESALYSCLYSYVFDIIRRYARGETAEQLNDILKSFIDLTDFTRIVRLKLSYRANPAFIRKALLPYGNFTSRTIDRMLECSTREDFTAAIGSTQIGKRALKFRSGYESLGMIPRTMNFRICRHYIDFSTHPAVVLISYLFTAETEISDIITIVEGIRYRLAPEEIRKLLVVVNN